MLGKQEDDVSSSIIAQQLTALEEKLGEIATHLQTKKRVKNIGVREVVQCSNEIFFGFRSQSCSCWLPCWAPYSWRCAQYHNK